MLLLDYWMHYEENDIQVKKRFTLHGDRPQLWVDGNNIPYIKVENGQIFEVNGDDMVPFTPFPKNALGEPFSVTEVLRDLLTRLSRNETGIVEPIFMSEIVNVYISAFRGLIAVHQERDIPYYIVFNNRLLKLAFGTDRFLYYDDSLAMPVMFRTEDGTLVADSEFADIGYYDSLDAVREGTQTPLTITRHPDWDAQEFVSHRFYCLLDADAIPEWLSPSENEEIVEEDDLPF